MPIYDYVCYGCNSEYEYLVLNNKEEKKICPRICPKCNNGLTKVVSKTSFQLKGNGWTPKYYK